VKYRRKKTSVRLAKPLAQALGDLVVRQGLACSIGGEVYRVEEVGEVEYSDARKSTFFLGLGNGRGYRITADIKVYQARERPNGGEARA
jgi:hypothetical protein